MIDLCTISTPDWLETHFVRWLRYAKKYAGDCKIHLFYVGSDMVPSWVSEAGVNVVCETENSRDVYNKIRMGAVKALGVKDVVYCDCDADIWDNLEVVRDMAQGKGLACVESPATHGDWRKFFPNKPEYNNGFLYMAKDWSREYDKAFWDAEQLGVSKRILGTIAFNLLLDETPDWIALPPDTSVIWWDNAKMPTARVIQWCNDRGQAKRLMLENEWRTAQ